jgi:hypothetical protein
MIINLEIEQICVAFAWKRKDDGTKAVPVLNELITKPRRIMGEWRYNSTILDLSTVASFTPRPLHPQFLLDRGKSSLQNPSTGIAGLLAGIRIGDLATTKQNDIYSLHGDLYF